VERHDSFADVWSISREEWRKRAVLP
jgi:hypothetical protein